jgi:type IV pilus assembly protein PilM
MSHFSDWISLRNAPPPTVAVELAAHRVSAATLEIRGGRPALAAYAVDALPDGALVPSLTGQNARDRGTVSAVLGRVLERVGRPRRVALVVPDAIAKVSLVRFEQVPARAHDLDQLVRWQVRKAAPFPLEEAQISYVAGGRSTEGQEFIVTLARRDVVQEYEELCAEAGAYAGLVDLSTFNVINSVLAGSAVPAGDWLLVNVASDYASIGILRGPHLIFFRSRGAGADGTLADLVHQTAMYYEDRLQGGGFGRLLVCGASTAGAEQAADVEQIRRSLEERLGTEIETVDVRGAATLTDRIAAAPPLLDALAPLVGVLLRGREVHVV